MTHVIDIHAQVDEDVGEIVVIRNALVSGANEIHAVAADNPRGCNYILVEHFLTNAELSARIASVYGRRFHEAERCRIDAVLARFRELASAALPNPQQLNLNDGDLVWHGQPPLAAAVS